MTDKQRLFVEEYLVDHNATAAAVRAGYSERTAKQQGSRLLTNVDVAAAIEKAREDRTERTEVTQDWVIERLVENVQRAMQAEPVRDREGNQTGEFVYAGSVANKGLELLGKHVGMFGTRQTNLNIDLSTLSDEQLARLAAGEDPISVLTNGG